MPTKFEIPTIEDIKSKTIKISSWKIYRTYLNKLAAAGYTTVQSLLDNQAEIVKIVKDANLSKDVSRRWMSAIIWCISDYPEKNKKILRQYQEETFDFPEEGKEYKDKDGVTKVWQSREQYFKNQNKSSDSDSDI